MGDEWVNDPLEERGRKLRPWLARDGSAGFLFWCPGCDQAHSIRTVRGTDWPAAPVWSFDGNLEAPTFEPSVLCYEPRPDGSRRTICHLFLRGGVLDLLSDSPYPLAGQKVPLPDWPR